MDLKGTDEFVVQLPGRPFEREVGSGQHDSIAHLVGRWWSPSAVGIIGHSFVGYYQSCFSAFECAGYPADIGVGGRVHHFRP